MIKTSLLSPIIKKFVRMKVKSLAEFKLNYSSPAKFNYNVTFTGNPLNR
jgi:hypothetical protein